MVTLNRNTQKAQNILDRYTMADPYKELWQVYGRFSQEKANALENCKRRCAELNGYGFKIVSHNSCVFTVGFETATGYVYETNCNEYFIPKDPTDLN